MLYDGEEMKAITENYVMRWSRQGMSHDLEQFDSHRVLFMVNRLNINVKKCLAKWNQKNSYDFFVHIFLE